MTFVTFVTPFAFLLQSERVSVCLPSISDARGILCGASKRREGAAPLAGTAPRFSRLGAKSQDIRFVYARLLAVDRSIVHITNAQYLPETAIMKASPESRTAAVAEWAGSLGAVVVTILSAFVHTLASPMRGGFSTGGLMREGKHPRTEVLSFATLPATHLPQMKSMLGTVSQARMHHNRPMNATDSPSLAAMRSILFQENPPSPVSLARDSALSPMHPHSFCSMFVASTCVFLQSERVPAHSLASPMQGGFSAAGQNDE